MIENEHNEFKEVLNDKFEKEVIAFLNSKGGGSIYIGVSDSGTVVGVPDVDETELKIKDRLKNKIKPSALGLFDIIKLKKGDRQYIQVMVSSGNQKPYYLSRLGMSPEGTFIRIGTAVEKMPEDMIFALYQKRNKITLSTKTSPRQDLHFSALEIYYRNKGCEIGPNLYQQFGLYSADGLYNYLAYLLADENGLPFQFAKYRGNDVFDLTARAEFINQSVITSVDQVLQRMQAENCIYTRITGSQRQEVRRFDGIAMREVIINAFVHNNYVDGGLPKFEVFDSYAEISSFGGLPDNYSEEDFFRGFSLSVNPQLMRVFHDLGLVEFLGTGIRRVLRVYDRNVFSFSINFIKVRIPFASGPNGGTNELDETGSKRLNEKILEKLKENPSLSRRELAKMLQVSESTIYRAIKQLVSQGCLIHQGSNKTGYWQQK